MPLAQVLRVPRQIGRRNRHKFPCCPQNLAVGKSGTTLSTGKTPEKKWRRGWDCSRLRRESSASLRTDACASSKIAARFCRTHGRDALNQEVRKKCGFAVPCNPLASPDFAVDLAIGANSPFRPRTVGHEWPLPRAIFPFDSSRVIVLSCGGPPPFRYGDTFFPNSDHRSGLGTVPPSRWYFRRSSSNGAGRANRFVATWHR
jgi:hypothetical protein